MAQPSFLFITGTARSGTNLVSRLLSAHPAVTVAIDPFLPLIRSFRNAVIRDRCDAEMALRFTEAPFQDYYFTDERLAVMDAIQEADLGMAFDSGERNGLLSALRARASLESPDVVPLLDRLSGMTFRELFDSALAMVGETRGSTGWRYVGIKEVWTIEFCAALARAYGDGKFIVIMRDPRAVVASMHTLAEKDSSQRAHTLSYARHWRKCAAFCKHYQKLPLLKNRFHMVRYEDLVADPESVTRRLCEFLEIDFLPQMTQTDNFWDPATKKLWQGNSSYTDRLGGIDRKSADRWRDTLDQSALKVIELACAPEMNLFDYQSSGPCGCMISDPEIFDFLLRDGATKCSWRSDFGDVQLDYGFELFRHALIGTRNAAQDPVVLRRAFLFNDLLDVIQQKALSANSALLEPST